MQKSIPVHYMDGVGWIAEPAFYLNKFQLDAVRRYTYKVNLDRWRCMMPGDQKDRVWKALEELKAGKLTQVPPKNEDGAFDLFKSTERLHPERMYSIPKLVQ